MSAENSTQAQPTTFDPRVDETCSVSQAAKMAGVSKRTIYNWMDGGLVAWIHTAGGGRRIFVGSLWRRP